jgi:hypothetical protein
MAERGLSRRIIVRVVPCEPPAAEVHAHACRHCPSALGQVHGHDPEVQDVLTWPRADQLETLFVCGWRPTKLCRGYVDTLACTPDELRARRREDGA